MIGYTGSFGMLRAAKPAVPVDSDLGRLMPRTCCDVITRPKQCCSILGGCRHHNSRVTFLHACMSIIVTVCCLNNVPWEHESLRRIQAVIFCFDISDS